MSPTRPEGEAAPLTDLIDPQALFVCPQMGNGVTRVQAAPPASPMGSDEVRAAAEAILADYDRLWRVRPKTVEALRIVLRQQSQPAASVMGEVRMLTDDEVTDTHGAAYRAAVEGKVTNGGMAGELWDRLAADAIQRKFCEVNGIRLSGEKGGDHG